MTGPKRSWPERLAKRMGRLANNLDQIEAKGRTSDKSYTRMLEELGDLCCQILDARDQAKGELDQLQTDTIFARRKMAEEQAALREERDDFHQERESHRSARKAEEAEHSRAMAEISEERRLMQEATSRAEQAEAKFKKFLKTVDTARGKL